MAIGISALVYLIAANLLLQTRLLRELVSKGPDLELEYDSAYSLWPGHAHFRGLSLAAQDYNVQFAIRIEQGEVDVSLHELLSKRFRALSLRAEGTAFRFRHKVRGVGDNAVRLAAYPPIGDYPDPPLYSGPKPPPLADADYDLWEIALDDIDARFSEIWILEHRYVGSGIAEGGFHLRPARWFEVHPARVTLAGGALRFGASTVAAALSLDVRARIARTDVTQVTGLDILRSVSAEVSLDSGDLDASVADAYLPEDLHALGWGRVSGAASVTSGVLDPDSRLDFTACPLILTSARGALEGSLVTSFRVTQPGRVVAQVASPAIVLSAREPQREAAAVVEPRFDVDFTIGDVSEPFLLQRADVSLPELRVPSLALLLALGSSARSPYGLDGRLDADARFAWRPQAALEGRAKARVVGGRANIGEAQAVFGARAEIDLRASDRSAPAASRGTVSLDLDQVTLSERDRQNPPFRLGVRTSSLSLVLAREPKVSATWRISAEPAETLLSVLIGAPVLEELAAAVLDLDRLDARTKLTANERIVRLDLARGQSGALAGQGFWQRPANGRASGAFLLTTSVANLGLAIEGSRVQTDMFAPDDWLEKRRAADPRLR